MNKVHSQYKKTLKYYNDEINSFRNDIVNIYNNIY